MPATTKPLSFQRFTAIQTRPNWKTQTDSSVTPTPASEFTFTLGGALWWPNAALIAITGVAGKYSGGMASQPITAVAPTGNFEISTCFQVGEGYLANCQALELGYKETDLEEVTYPGQIQFDNSTSATEAMIDVVNSKGLWQPTGFQIPKFATYVDHLVSARGFCDSVKKVLSMQAVTVNGQSFMIGAAQQNVAGALLNWKSGSVGFQPDVNTKGGAFNWLVKDITLDLW